MQIVVDEGAGQTLAEAVTEAAQTDSVLFQVCGKWCIGNGSDSVRLYQAVPTTDTRRLKVARS